MELKEIIVKCLWVLCLCLYFYILIDKRKIRKLLNNNMEQNHDGKSKSVEKAIKKHNILIVATLLMSVILLVIK